MPVRLAAARRTGMRYEKINACRIQAGIDYMEQRRVVMVKSSGVLHCAGKKVPAFRGLVLSPYLGSSNSELFLARLTLKVKTLPFLK